MVESSLSLSLSPSSPSIIVLSIPSDSIIGLSICQIGHTIQHKLPIQANYENLRGIGKLGRHTHNTHTQCLAFPSATRAQSNLSFRPLRFSVVFIFPRDFFVLDYHHHTTTSSSSNQQANSLDHIRKYLCQCAYTFTHTHTNAKLFLICFNQNDTHKHRDRMRHIFETAR